MAKSALIVLLFSGLLAFAGELRGEAWWGEGPISAASAMTACAPARPTSARRQAQHAASSSLH